MITLLPVFRFKVFNIGCRYSVKAIKATINLNNVEAENVTGDIIGNVEVIAGKIDIMLY